MSLQSHENVTAVPVGLAVAAQKQSDAHGRPHSSASMLLLQSERMVIWKAAFMEAQVKECTCITGVTTCAFVNQNTRMSKYSHTLMYYYRKSTQT